jgi:uncharacterized membrane protein (UPF0136 family)
VDYSAPIDAEGVFYYYIIVTNTVGDNGDGGQKTASVASSAVTVAVTVTNAQNPTIALLPVSETVAVEASVSLIVSANSLDSGVLSYQWHTNTTASNIGGTPIDGATSAIYAVPTDVEGVYSYYVVVTNTIEDNGDGGLKAASVASSAVILSVGVTAVNVRVPTIAKQPASATVAVGASHSLTVLANTAGSGTISYQWYVNTAASSSGGMPIDGATDATYAIPTEAVGTSYYYVVATNAIADNGDGGLKAATTASAVAVVKVSLHVSVLSQARIIPNTPQRMETAVLAPITALPSSFAVGPNPVQRGGAVKFFYRDMRVGSGVLIVYDAGGNFVKKLKILGKPTPSNGAKPCLSSWDLTDKKSRPVATGMYLVKGVVSSPSGKKERVSAVVVVR